MIDLHAHTTASDGALAPAALVRLALASGVRVLAITDHDTTAGLAEAVRAAEEAGRALRVVPGIEISARLRDREIHLLGHFVDPHDEALQRRLAAFAEARGRRMEAMVERCRAAGLDVSLEEVEARREPGGTLGRPHLARLLVEKGHARDVQDAFDRWLGRGGPAWVERPLPEAAEAIALVRDAGGCAAVVHPGLSGLGKAALRELAAAGLEGVEIDHPGHNVEQRRSYRAIARALGLHATAGSDFHTVDGTPAHPGTETMEMSAFSAWEACAGRRRATR